MGIKREKVFKIIKKTGKVFAWFFGIMLLLIFGAYLFLRSPACQTWLCQKIASHFSDELKTKITIGGVDVEFFNSVILEKVYVEDRHGDTILWAGKLKADIKTFSYSDQYVNVSSVELSDALIKLKKYKGEHGLSYRFIQDYFKDDDTTKKSGGSPWKVDIGDVNLKNIVIAYIDTRFNDPARGMDFDDIRISGLNAHLSNFDPMGDSLRFRIVDMKAYEKCGFTLTHLSALMTVCDTFAKFDNVKIATRNGTDIEGFLGFQFDGGTDDVADDFIHLVKMDHHFSSSIVEMADIAYFAPDLLGMKKKILVTGDVKGTVEHLRCKNIDLRFGETSQLAGNFDFNGLPDFENTNMNFRIRNVRTNAKDLEGIPIAPFASKDRIDLPSNIYSLGEMQFSGNIDGFLNDFVAQGTFHSALGSMKLDNLAMLDVADSAIVKYDGKLTADAFNIGTFLGVDGLGNVSGSATVNGRGFPNPGDILKPNAKLEEVSADITGDIAALTYNGYTYTGIKVTDGALRRNSFVGTLDINDPNVRLTFSGKATNLNATPDLDFKAHIDSANLGALHFMDNDKNYYLSTNMNIRIKGSNIDNIEGVIDVSDLTYIKDTNAYSFNTLTFVAGPTVSGRRIFLESDIASASVEGNFQLLKLPAAIGEVMSQYLPAYFPPPDPKKKKDETQEQFAWNLKFNKNTKPLEAIFPDLYISPNTVFRGNFDKNNRRITSSLFAFNTIKYGAYTFREINASFNNTDNPSYMELKGTIDRVQMNDTVGLDNFSTTLRASNNDLVSNVTWNNVSKHKNDGNIISTMHFLNQHSFTMNFAKADITVNDSSWNVTPGNRIAFDTSRISITDLVFHSGTQHISANGVISKSPADQMNVDLSNFNLAYLNYYTVPEIGLKFSGLVSGPTQLSDLYHTPIFNSNLDFKQLYLNDEKIGDGNVDAVWQQPKERVYIHGHFTRGVPVDAPIDNILFDGFYYPKKKENSIDINADLVAMRLQILEPMMKDFCSMIRGDVDGKLHVGGEPGHILLNGKLDVVSRRIIVDYLGLTLNFPKQTVYVEENSFFFNKFKISDGNNDTATVYGHLYHENFKNWQFDMDFDFPKPFMVLNTTENQNELYYGKVFATGYMNIFGYVDQTVQIDMTLATDKIIQKGQPVYSEFYVPMTSTSEVSNNDFITYVSHDTTIHKQAVVKNSGLDLNMNITVNDNAKVHVVFDKTVGDELTAKGNGDITMHISPAGDFNIFGQYIVDEGNYLFTMKNVVYVPFQLGKGGVISWNGDPYKAQIDADAVYTTTASVEPFFINDSTNQAYHRSYPVNVIMHLDSSLMNPTVAFDIRLPTADQNIQETINSYTQTELERNKQVLSLMVLNSFMTPSELRTDVTSGPAYGNAGTTLLSNFVSGTLNNWLSQISSDFNMGVKYRPNDDMTTQELKVYLGTQLLNNKMTIEANGGKVNANQSSSSSSASQWVGDVNVDYKVTEDGKVRLIAYYRTNDAADMSTSNAPTTQGAGVFYKEEFESLAELMKRYKEAFTRENPNRKPKPN